MPHTWPAQLNRPTVLGLIVVVSCIVSASPLLAAEPLIDGRCELSPKPDGRSPFAVHGWAIADCDEAADDPLELVVRIDGAEFIRGNPYLARPDVADRYPDVPGADLAGFWAQVDPALLDPGEHDIEVVALACGIETTLLRESFPSAGPTSALIATPLLLLSLGVLGVAGWFLARLPTHFWPIRRLPAIIAIFAIAVVVVVVAARHLGASIMEVDAGLFMPLANWDGRFYLGLAAEGYGPEVNSSFGYFPLYPALLAFLSVLPLPLPLMASLVNVALFLTAIALLRRLYPDQDSAILLFATLPFAFFHFVVYTETLALVLAVAYLHSLRRESLVGVAVFGFLAGMTRITALPLAFFALEPLRRRDWRGAAVAAFSPVAGLTTWMLYLGVTTGDPLAFLHSMSDFGRSVSFDPGRLLDLVVSLPARGPAIWWELGSLILVLVVAAALLARRRFGEACYSAAIVLMPLYTVRLTSINRYALAAFPVFLLLGGILGGILPRKTFYAVVGAELVLLLIFAARFGLQIWVG